MDDWVMVPRERLEALSKLTNFNTSTLAAKIAHEVKQWLTAAPQQQTEPVAWAVYWKSGGLSYVQVTQPQGLYSHEGDEQYAVPLYTAPRITAEQGAELKRLADELTQSAVDVAVAECAVMMVDPGIKYKRQQVDEDRAALHAALDALVKP